MSQTKMTIARLIDLINKNGIPYSTELGIQLRIREADGTTSLSFADAESLKWDKNTGKVRVSGEINLRNGS